MPPRHCSESLGRNPAAGASLVAALWVGFAAAAPLRAATSSPIQAPAPAPASASTSTSTSALTPAPTPEGFSGSAELQALERLYAGDRAGADSLLTAEIAARPAALEPLLARMKLAWWGILEGRDTDGELERGLRADFEALRRRADKRLRDHRRDAVAAWALGEAHCTVGRLEGLRGGAWATFHHHQRGVALLELARRERPAAPEPAASLGLYRYYAARLPRSLRLLGRLVQVRGDRDAGLGDLRRAAATPGVQQVEATFFLLEILSHMEDENLEAANLALHAATRYPHHTGFALQLASVLVNLERPDLALAILEAPGEPDPQARVQRRFLAARVAADTGCPARALGIMRELDATSACVTWIAPWRVVYEGICRARRGDLAAAQAAFLRAESGPDIAGARAAARQARAALEDSLAPARWEADSLLAWGDDAAAAQRRLEAALRAHPASEPGAAFLLALGTAALRNGDSDLAVSALRRAMVAGSDEARLVARPRLRLLQALLWAERCEEARALAAALAPRLGEWGTNRQLALLCEAAQAGPRARPQPAASAAGERFELVDAGFATVDLVLAAAAGESVAPMTCRDGRWSVHVPLPPGSYRYVFRIGGREPLLDPAAPVLLGGDSQAWSERQITAPSS